MLQVANLEDRFGKTCELSSNFRTIEGHCNNLAHPSRGAANHPLKRLSKNDPSYADDERAPNGPANISPRLVSNLVFAQSKEHVFCTVNSFKNLKCEAWRQHTGSV